MDYRSMVNPTYLTAKSTLLMLAGSGNEDAKRMIAGLNTQDELKQKSDKAAKDSNEQASLFLPRKLTRFRQVSPYQ